MPTSVAKFNFLALIVSDIKRLSQNLMWGYYPPTVPRTLKHLPMLQVLSKVKQPAKLNVVSLCTMQLCEYVFPVGFPLYVPKNGVLGVLRVKM